MPIDTFFALLIINFNAFMHIRGEALKILLTTFRIFSIITPLFIRWEITRMKEFFNKLLNGMSIGIVVSLIPNALLW